MSAFTDSLNFDSCLACLSSSLENRNLIVLASCSACLSSGLENRALIMLERSVCATKDEAEGEISSIVVSLEALGRERVFVEGDTMRNKYWVGIVKFSE